ncbi:MAG: DUF4350 domain-containing protein [Bacteroidia bacterium]
MKKDKIPFGTSALHDALPSIFPNQLINDEQYPLYNSLNGKGFQGSNYIIINQNFEPDKLDSKELFDFVKRGNNVFVAANYFSGHFADTLKIKTDDYFNLGDLYQNDSAAIHNIYKPNDTTKINFVSPHLKSKNDYTYTKGISNTYFTSFDTSKTTVLGVSSAKNINFIKIKWGKGQLFISTVPEVFSNYLFVNKNNYDYIYKALSYLPVQQTFWDEYYKVGNVVDKNPLRVIFNNAALSAAYYVLMISLLLFIIVGIKRKQRMIPVITPLRNTTLDFVEIVGTLYFHTGNHKNIADKKITYFLEYIRNAFQVKTNLYDDVFIERITNLSGIEKQKIHDLFYYFSHITFKQEVTQDELLKLNKMIEEFHKENKR